MGDWGRMGDQGWEVPYSFFQYDEDVFQIGTHIFLSTISGINAPFFIPL